jgi:peptidoglycan/LPS O-acetylase OafA/YrhL
VQQASIKSLTSLRWLCAFYVFLFHMEIRVPVFGAGAVQNFILGGYAGMSFFFILSGFVLTIRYFYTETPYLVFVRARI